MYSIKKSDVGLMLTSLYLLCAIIYQQHLFTEVISKYHFFVLILLGLLLVSVNLPRIEEYKSKAIALMIITLIFFVSMVRGELFIGSVFSILISVSAATIIYKAESNLKLKIYLLIPFYFYMIYIVFRLVYNPDPNSVFINSRNWISFYSILLVAPYYLGEMIKGNRVLVLPSIVLLTLSFYSLGRSGIASSLILFAAVLIYEKRKRYLFFLAPIGILLFKIYLEEAVSLYDTKRLINFFGADERQWIWSFYFENVDLYSLIFGMNIRDMNAAVGYTNLHSSFLHLIFYSGVAGYFLFFLISASQLLLLKRSFLASIVFFALLIRLSTDTGALFGLFDVSIWMCILFLLRPQIVRKFVRRPLKSISCS